jgi:hypothetical protein
VGLQYSVYLFFVTRTPKGPKSKASLQHRSLKAQKKLNSAPPLNRCNCMSSESIVSYGIGRDLLGGLAGGMLPQPHNPSIKGGTLIPLSTSIFQANQLLLWPLMFFGSYVVLVPKCEASPYMEYNLEQTSTPPKTSLITLSINGLSKGSLPTGKIFACKKPVASGFDGPASTMK